MESDTRFNPVRLDWRGKKSFTLLVNSLNLHGSFWIENKVLDLVFNNNWLDPVLVNEQTSFVANLHTTNSSDLTPEIMSFLNLITTLSCPDWLKKKIIWLENSEYWWSRSKLRKLQSSRFGKNLFFFAWLKDLFALAVKFWNCKMI